MHAIIHSMAVCSMLQLLELIKCLKVNIARDIFLMFVDFFLFHDIREQLKNMHLKDNYATKYYFTAGKLKNFEKSH